MGGIVLAIAQSWHQSWWIINIFSFNFSLSPISLYLFIINFICCEYLSYLRRSSLAFTHALVLSPSHNWESLGKTKRNACLHILMYFNCCETNMSRIHYKYLLNTGQMIIEYTPNMNWRHTKKRNVQKGKSCLPAKLSTSHTLGDLSGRNFSRGITCRLPKVPQISPTWPRTPEISSALTENSKNFATYHQKRHKFHQLWPQVLPTLTKSITNFTNFVQKQHKAWTKVLKTKLSFLCQATKSNVTQYFNQTCLIDLSNWKTCKIWHENWVCQVTVWKIMCR